MIKTEKMATGTSGFLLNTREGWAAAMNEVRTLDIATGMTQPVIYNDAYFREMIYPAYAIDDTVTRKELSAACQKFLTWYVTGTDKDNSLFNCMVVMISAIPNAEGETLFEFPKLQKTKKIKAVGEVSLVENPDYISSAQGLISGSNEAGSSNVATLDASLVPILISKEDCTKWYKGLYHACQFKENQDTSHLSYVCFLAMHCMRYSLKDKEMVGSHITKTFHTKFQKIWRQMELYPGHCPPPHDNGVKDWAVRFSWNSNNFRSLFSLMLMAKITGMRNPMKDAVLNASCFVTYRWNGMGIIKNLMDCVLVLQVDLASILDCFAFEEHKSTIKEIIVVLKHQGGNVNRTIPWSRLLEDGAFPMLSRKADMKMFGILMALKLGLDPKSPTWGALKMDDKPISPLDIAGWCDRGQAIKDTLDETKNRNPLSTAALRVNNRYQATMEDRRRSEAEKQSYLQRGREQGSSHPTSHLDSDDQDQSDDDLDRM